MEVSPNVNFEELARSTDEFNGAQLKAVCVEAGMIALREGASQLNHEHFHSGIAEGELLVYFAMILILTLFDYSAEQEEERFDVLCIVYSPRYYLSMSCLSP
jgi:SpoVK/Ycf46/Vps4 family AAA+-type ATPase